MTFDNIEDAMDLAHKHCGQHKAEILASEYCGCFYCLRRCAPEDVPEWVNDGTTAICPHCYMDTLIGNASGFELTEQFLAAMKGYWFKPSGWVIVKNDQPSQRDDRGLDR